MLWTILVAMTGWIIGMTPVLFFMSEDSTAPITAVEPDPTMYFLMSIFLGISLGALFGLFQWFALRKYVRKAAKWILANMIGWTFGMFFIFLFASLPDHNSNIFFIIFSGASGGILAGLSVGGVTGMYLLRFEEI